MTSANAPYPTFNGIIYNKAFFSTSSDGLTTAKANALYLQKTVADTATSLETFSGGILTTDIDTQITDPPSVLRIGKDNAGNVCIGDASCPIFLYGDVNATKNSYCNSYDALYNVALELGSTNATAVNIGKLATPTNVKGALNTTGLTTATGGIKTNSINGIIDTTTTLFHAIQTYTATLFPNMTTGDLFIGATATSGATRTTGTIHIGDGNSASGAIHIGNGVSATNNVNILNGASSGGTVNIATGATSTTAINIGTNTSGAITIGGTGAMSLNGSTITSNNTFKSNTINSISGTMNLNVGGTVSAGTVYSPYLNVSNDTEVGITFRRNGQFTIGIAATANPKLIMGVVNGASPGNEVQILSLGTGTVYSNNGLLTNTNPSDASIKKNIIPLNVSIEALNPVEYEWIDSKMGTGLKYGFLANEVNELFPNICSTWKTDDEIPETKLGIDTVSLIPIIVSAVKKMKLEFEARISKLEHALGYNGN